MLRNYYNLVGKGLITYGMSASGVGITGFSAECSKHVWAWPKFYYYNELTKYKLGRSQKKLGCC